MFLNPSFVKNYKETQRIQYGRLAILFLFAFGIFLSLPLGVQNYCVNWLITGKLRQRPLRNAILTHRD